MFTVEKGTILGVLTLLQSTGSVTCNNAIFFFETQGQIPLQEEKVQGTKGTSPNGNF